MATLHCLGASQEVGRSAFLLETDKRILLDYGIKVFDIAGEPKYPIPFEGAADAAIISHAHLDHSGFVPTLYRHQKIKWFATPPTKDICDILWKDSMKIMGPRLPYDLNHFKHAMHSHTPINYGTPVNIGATKFRFLDAGHICGSAMVELEHNRKFILYTGDFKMEESRMHRGAKPVEDVSTVIIDSTYGTKEHPNRKALEQKLADEIQETTAEGGSVLFPAFSLGRTQELISLVRAYNKDVPIFVDGMGKSITQVYLKYQKYLKDGGRFRKDVETVRMVSEPYERREATRGRSVIISSAGMMEGGRVLEYLTNINSYSKIIFTGFNVDGTNGWKLINKGYVTMEGRDLEVSLPVEYMDFSAHSGKSDILNFIKWANPEKIVIVHTDTGKELERELKEDMGYNAVAPTVGDKIEV